MSDYGAGSVVVTHFLYVGCEMWPLSEWEEFAADWEIVGIVGILEGLL